MKDIDYGAVLADLEQRRAELDAAISAIRQITGQAVATSTSPASLSDIPSDAFFGLSILAGAKKYLGMTKRPRKAPDIAAALERGGYLNKSRNFTATVYTTLRRAEDRGGGIVQMPDKAWGLTIWYPGGKPKRANAKESEVQEEEPEINAEETTPDEPADASGQGQPS